MADDIAAKIADDPTAIVGFFVILLLSLSWHEAAHAWVADRLGDPTAREHGRVSLNPLRHIDPFFSILLPAMLYFAGARPFGGGKPVPINVNNFRHRARDFMLVALAGPGSNLLLAVGFGLVFVICSWTGVLQPLVIGDPYVGQRVFAPFITDDPVSITQFWLQSAVVLNLALALFNLIPIPPLDGSRIIGWLLPRPLQPGWYRLDRIGVMAVLLVFVFFNEPLVWFQQVIMVSFFLFGNMINHLSGLVTAS